MPRSLNVFFLLLSIIISLPYSNTFNVDWQLDDEPNIITNSKLHISEVTFQQLNSSFRANPTSPNSDKLYRPLPCLTFGLNWYFGQDNVVGYHIVNLAIHILTAWCLFLTLHLLLQIYYQKKQSPQFFITAALLGALFWALAPIQTQAVTYIVQRMASMAAMFTIIAIYAYLRGRIEKRYYLWFSLCLLSCFAALGSKENAILLPASLILIEVAFFTHQITKKDFLKLIIFCFIVLVGGFFFVRHGLGITPFNLFNPLSFLESYKNRSFTFSERILTQPRIVLMYLSQIFIPAADRLSIEHDVILSTSLFTPWTTLSLILLILLLISSALFFLKKYPLVCFPVLFFFLNHAVESTILQLELVFEHRNYLPSLFLFLPAGVLIARILYSNPPQPVLFRRTAAAVCATLFLIISGHATYTRNMAWATEGTLWTDAIRKAPNSARAAHSLGKWHRQFGEYRQAYHYFQLALLNADKAADPKLTKKAALNGLASVVYMLGSYDQSLQYFNQCLEIDATDEACLKNRVLAYIQLGQPEKALPDGLKLTEKYPLPMEYQYLTAVAAYQVNAQDIALNRMKKVVSMSLENQQVIYLIGLLMLKERAYPNSLFFLKQAVKLSPNDIDSQIALAAAHHADNQAMLAEKILYNIYKKHPLPVITNALQGIQKHNWDNNIISFIKTSFDSMIKSTSVHYEQQQHPAP